ncbi:hypothetical protein D3C86_1458910 [compost metagenome]
MSRAQPTRDAHPLGHGIHANDCRRAFEPRTRDRAESDGPQGKHRNGIADFHLASFGPRKPGRHDVRAHQNLLVTEPIRNRAQIGKGVRYQHVLGLTAIDDVAELPATGGAKAVAGIWTILGTAATQAGITLPAGRDGTGNHPLPFDITAHL